MSAACLTNMPGPACGSAEENIMRTNARTPGMVLMSMAVIVVWANTAGAQTTLTPFFAIGDDLAPGGGAAFSIPWTASLSVEAEASLGTDAARSSVSLLYSLPRVGRFTPYVAGGGGVQRDEFQTGTSSGFFIRKKTELAANIGAGVTIAANDRWSYRADFRWYNPKAEWPESWRAYSGIVFGIRR
jgi:hypothetical protein